MGEALNNIIQSCFEGFFGTMIAGWLFYTLQSIRKNRRMLIWLWMILFAMAIWRFFIPNFYSPRYAIIFIFPAILLTAYMMVKFKKWWWLMLVALGIVCGGKVLRPNPTGHLLIDAGKVISRDAAGKRSPAIIIKQKDVRRMEFYSSIPALPFDESKNITENLRYLPRIIANASRQSDAVYICCDVPHGMQITAKELKLDGELDLIFSVLRNRKRKIYFNVYRYCRTSENIKPAVPTGKNLIINGDFENHTDFFQPQDIVKKNLVCFTAKTDDPWNLYITYPSPQLEAETALNGAINGKRSLRLKARRHPFGVYSELFFINGKAEFFSRIKGKAGTTVAITLWIYNSKQGGDPRVINLLPVKIMKDDQLIETVFEFDPAEYDAAGKFFRLLLAVSDGEAYFDDITVVNR